MTWALLVTPKDPALPSWAAVGGRQQGRITDKPQGRQIGDTYSSLARSVLTILVSNRGPQP